jgi:hypothetical protein
MLIWQFFITFCYPYVVCVCVCARACVRACGLLKRFFSRFWKDKDAFKWIWNMWGKVNNFQMYVLDNSVAFMKALKTD